MQQELQKNNLHGTLITMQFPRKPGIVASKRYGPGVPISYTGMHMGVSYNGLVYCVIYPDGKPEFMWINSFHDGYNSKPKVTITPF